MTDDQKKRCATALLGPRSDLCNDRIWSEFIELTDHDVKRLEPVIDKIVAEELEKAGLKRKVN